MNFFFYKIFFFFFLSNILFKNTDLRKFEPNKYISAQLLLLVKAVFYSLTLETILINSIGFEFFKKWNIVEHPSTRLYLSKLSK